MSDIELNPTGEMLLDCMDKLERIQAKHAALVEAVENHCADLLYWANLNIYSVELRDEINRMVDKIKAAAQEKDDDRPS